VGDTGIEPVTPTVSRLPRHIAHLDCKLFAQVGAPRWVPLLRVLPRFGGLSSPKDRPLIMNVRPVAFCVRSSPWADSVRLHTGSESVHRGVGASAACIPPRLKPLVIEARVPLVMERRNPQLRLDVDGAAGER
jgi:hypothetical protein